jgi:hypothetical protein
MGDCGGVEHLVRARVRTRSAIRRVLAHLGVLTVASSLLGVVPAAHAATPKMTLRVNQFAAPLTEGGAGRRMPVYVGWSQNTLFDGNQATAAPRDLVSNTVSIPRSQWGGPGADEWSPALGVLAGSLFPFPMDETADSYYLWSGVTEGAAIQGGDDIGLLKMWYSSFHHVEGGYEPTGRAGALTWRTEAGWSNVLRSTTTDYSAAELPDGTGVRGPAIKFRRALYLSHTQLSAQGGDVHASAGAVTAPAHEFRAPSPPGTVMNAQLVGYSPAGPWSGQNITFDFNAGSRSAATGEWRLPVTVSVKQGSFIPERADVATSASPQFSLAMTALGIPLAPEEAGPGANDIHLVANVVPGQEKMRYVMALRQPDGSIRVQHLNLGEPGPHIWRVADGELVEVSPPDGAPSFRSIDGEDTTVAPTDPGAAMVGAEEGSSEAAEADPLPNRASIQVNADGRPMLTDVVRDDVSLVDSYDVTTVITEDGPTELGTWNRDGPVSTWGNAAGTVVSANVAYEVDGLLVIVRLASTATTFYSYLTTHSLDGEAHPHEVRGVGDVAGEARLVDRLVGAVDRTMRMLPADLSPRLVVETGKRAFGLGPLNWQGGTVDITDGGAEPSGGPLLNPVVIATIPGPEVWSGGVSWIQFSGAPQPLEPPVAGAFTSASSYRVVPFVTDRPVVIGGGPLEPTRDFDGAERIGLAFAAKRPDGTTIRQQDVTGLFLSLRTADGASLFSAKLTSPPWTPDDGTTWGVVLEPVGELPSMDVFVYVRAAYAGGMVTAERSPAIPAADWRFAIDRMPVVIDSVGDGVVSGTTQPHALLTGAIPELGLTSSGSADENGDFAMEFSSLCTDGDGMTRPCPGGDYEVVVKAVSVVPPVPEGVGGPTVGDAVPDDEVGWATARMFRYSLGQAGGHRSEPPVDVAAAVQFLASREDDGAFDRSLRATAWAIRGLRTAGAPLPPETDGYLDSLQAGDGYAWRSDGEPSAAAAGLAASAMAALGTGNRFDSTAPLRWDGGGVSGEGLEVSSVEGAGLAVLGLDATADLAAFDPFWADRIGDFLEAATPRGPAEAFARAAALETLGRPVAAEVPTSPPRLDAAAYRVLLGIGTVHEVAPYQLLDGGGFALVRGTPEAFPTGLALATLD